MYVVLMRDISEKYYRLHYEQFKIDVDFTGSEVDNVIEFINKFGIQEYKQLFDVIEIRYQSILDGGLVYSIDGKTLLHIKSLSSGERMMLYGMIMSRLNKPFIIVGLADRLDKKHRSILLDFPDYFKTTIIIVAARTARNQRILNKYHRSFDELLKEGVLL